LAGVWIGHPSDWSTFYARSMALLPEFRGRGFFLDFFTRVAATLKGAGVERIESETAPTNVAVNLGFVRLGWVVTGTVNTDRWGTMLRYTKFLSPEAERCFQRQFLAVPAATGQEPATSRSA
jgi:hypothetical protein